MCYLQSSFACLLFVTLAWFARSCLAVGLLVDLLIDALRSLDRYFFGHTWLPTGPVTIAPTRMFIFETVA